MFRFMFMFMYPCKKLSLVYVNNWTNTNTNTNTEFMNSYFPGLLMFSIQPTIHSYPLQPKVQPLRHKYPIYLLMSMFDLMNLCKNILLCICMFLIQSPLLPTPTLCLECPRYVFMSIFDFMNLCKNILLCICIFLIQSTPPTHPHPVSRVS